DWVNVVDDVNSAGGHAQFSASGARTASLLRTGLVSASLTTFEARCVLANYCGSVVSDVAVLRINSSDFDTDGSPGTSEDIEAFFRCLSGICCQRCGTADFDGDGDLATDQDVTSFFRVLG